MTKRGLRIVNTNCKFDPNVHEVLAQENGDDDGKIIEVFSKGYFLNDKLIRPSKVKIIKVK